MLTEKFCGGIDINKHFHDTVNREQDIPEKHINICEQHS